MRRAPFPFRPRADVGANLRTALLQARAMRARDDLGALEEAFEHLDEAVRCAVADVVSFNISQWERLYSELEPPESELLGRDSNP